MKQRILILALLFVSLATTALASDQYRRHRYNHFKGLATNEQSIVFVGNSITDMANWPEAFGNDPRIVSRGVSGGFSYEVLANVYNWIIGHPAKVFIKIGTNDLNGYGTPTTVAANVEKTVAICLDESPKTKVYIQSVLPCQNGKRSDADIRTTNELLKAMCERYANAEFVDLYSKMTAVKNGFPYGCPDNLHVAGAGYAVWCNAIADLVGIPTVYPAGATAASKQNTYGQNNVHGGRISAFSLQPTKKEDIIFIGDGLVQSGEWNELLPGSGIKNHGSGWEVGSCDNGVTANIIDATLKADASIVREMPRAILLYACSGSYDATTYENFIKKINGYSTDIKVYCVGLQPKASAYSTANNTSIKNICAKYDNVSYIDIATELNKHVGEAAYYTENHPYYMSYVTIAQQIAAQAPDLGLTAMTTLDAQRNYALAEAAAVILTATAGDGLSQYPADKMKAAKDALDALRAATTDAEVQAATAALSTAIDALKKSINGATAANTADRHYTLSTPNRSSLYAYANASALYSTSAVDPADAKFRWTFEDRGNGTFNIKNVLTGEYMSPTAAHDSQIKLATAAPAAGFTLEYSDAAGLYIIRSGSNCELNTTTNAGNPVYNWYGNSGNTNRTDPGCQWRVEDVTDIEIPEAPEPGEYDAEQKIRPDVCSMLRGGSSEVTSGWFSVIKTKQTPVVTISGGTVNNITTSGTDAFILAEGNATTFTYTVSVPEGYIIESMQADIKNQENNPTVNFAGKNVTCTDAVQTVKVSDIGKSSVTITLTSTTANAKALFSNWTVNVTTGNVDPKDPGVKYSKEGDEHWYYIVNASTKDYCKGKVMLYDSAADRMKHGAKSYRADRIWSFWEKDGKLAIKNYNGVWMGSPASTTQGGNSWVAKANSANYAYTIAYYADGQFTIGDGKGNPLHAQDSGSLIVRWQAEANGASLWNFEAVDTDNPQADISYTLVQQGKVTTGIGNKNCPILRSTLGVGGLEGQVNFEGFSGKVKNPENVKAVRAYFAKNAQELYVDDDNLMAWREQNGELFGQGTLATDGSYTIKGSKVLSPEDHYLWLAIDIADDAKEGATVDATITSYTVDGKTVAEKAGDPANDAIIFLAESAALMPMDKGSLYYRIPAICTSADGKRLVILTDDRKAHGSDLPSHCYVVAQYSEDGGKSWSEPLNVAGTAKTGGDYGHGDASLITNRITGEITGIMTTSANGQGFFGSTAAKPQTWKTITSKDGGRTWSVPADHTKELYAEGSPNPTWQAGFTGSGAGLQKRDGTLVSPFVNREADKSQNYYSFMSKDGGKTWYVSGKSGTTGADEPKVLERNNGDLAISVRHNGYNFYNYTTDDGETWKNAPQTPFTSGINGNACDGEYMYWCSKLDGNANNIVLQTGPTSSSREKVAIALSTDEGKTFGTPKVFCQRGSAYSAATVLPDGTLGVYYEENGLFGGYTMRFIRFSLDWASGGKYKFTDDKPFYPIQTHVDITTPASGLNSIVLPFAADVPEGMTVYECTDETTPVTIGGVEMTGTVLQPLKGRMEGFHPYIFTAEANSKFTFDRPISEWEPQELPKNCEAVAGPLKGWFVNDVIKGDGTTLYTTPQATTEGEGFVFNLIAKNSSKTQKAYTASYVRTGEGEAPAAIAIAYEKPEGIDATAADTPTATPAIYDLGGRKVLVVPAKSVSIVGGKKVIR